MKRLVYIISENSSTCCIKPWLISMQKAFPHQHLLLIIPLILLFTWKRDALSCLFYLRLNQEAIVPAFLSVPGFCLFVCCFVSQLFLYLNQKWAWSSCAWDVYERCYSTMERLIRFRGFVSFQKVQKCYLGTFSELNIKLGCTHSALSQRARIESFKPLDLKMTPWGAPETV